MPYDPVVAGNDAFLVKREGKIVALWGYSGLSAKQLQRLHPDGLKTFYIIDDDGEYQPLRAVTPEDALELIRREFIPEYVAEFESGERTLFTRGEFAPVHFTPETDKRIIFCPQCGSGELTVDARVVVTYEIDPKDGSWMRLEVSDDSSEALSVSCVGCTTMWEGTDVKSDSRGLLQLGGHRAEECGTTVD